MKLKDRDAVQLTTALAEYGSVVREGVSLAAYAHEGQFRKESRPGVTYTDPYVAHPIRNALRVIRFTQGHMSLDDVRRLAVICLLHDTVEDAPERVVTFYTEGDSVVSDDIRELALFTISTRFGDKVADGVRRVTNPELPEGITREDKDAEYLNHITSTVVVSEDAYLTKAMDLIDNAGSLKHMDVVPRRARLASKYTAPVALMAEHASVVSHPVVRAAVTARLEQVAVELQRLSSS